MVSGRRHNADDLVATALAVEPVKTVYRGRWVTDCSSLWANVLCVCVNVHLKTAWMHINTNMGTITAKLNNTSNTLWSVCVCVTECECSSIVLPLVQDRCVLSDGVLWWEDSDRGRAEARRQWGRQLPVDESSTAGNIICMETYYWVKSELFIFAEQSYLEPSVQSSPVRTEAGKKSLFPYSCYN